MSASAHRHFPGELPDYHPPAEKDFNAPKNIRTFNQQHAWAIMRDAHNKPDNL
jgi:hypothetical protein